jgi:hypothetical protein
MLFSPLKVYCNDKGEPVKVIEFAGEFQVKEIFEFWHDVGCWWEGESEKVFYRLLYQDRGIREIFQDLDSKRWFLYKIYD